MDTDIEPLLYGDCGPRTLIRLSGVDAASYLHNLCTQEIRGLQPGQATEAFITSVQGKTLGYVRIFREAASLLLETSPGQAETLLTHFEKYHIREKVEFHDLSATATAFIASTGAMDAYLAAKNFERGLADHAFAVAPEPNGVLFARWEVAGPGLGYGLIIDRGQSDDWLAFVESEGPKRLTAEEIEARRIAAGSVEFGKDVTEENLPQEVARDEKAISFTKGCYLGQETVARIDALGHVNRLLVRLRCDGKSAISSGQELRQGDKAVGRITSVAFWEAQDASVALGYVKRGAHAAGTALQAGDITMQVVG